jgi:hypothetical protein
MEIEDTKEAELRANVNSGDVEAMMAGRTYPPSSSKEDLETNTLRSLESIPLPMMRKFATRSWRFLDAYDRGLNGKQAAWAARKYRGHRVLPQNLMDELGKEGLIEMTI